MAEAEAPLAGGPRRELAALDLGSNSFHLIVAQEANGRLQVVDRIREMVRLAGGLDADNRLKAPAARRALACLERFGQRLRHLTRDNVRVVGTNALRKACDAQAFLERAEAALGHPVEIIAGREEARLIYLGVSHALEDSRERRLVIDIGGGSTELILGRRFQPEEMESLYMGCVGLTEKHFANGRLSGKAFARAINEAKQELQAIRNRYLSLGWDLAIGASGTILAVQDVLAEMRGDANGGIDPKGVQTIIRRLTEARHVNDLDLPSLPAERRAVFAGGVAVLAAILESLQLECLQVSQGALREGLLHDLVGRVHRHDTRDETVRNLMARYHVDAIHARRVRDTALGLLAQTAVSWGLQDSANRLLLGWAADLHEIGMDIAHSQYHKHGGYLLANMDMPGFSRLDQAKLASLVRSHRRKFPLSEEDGTFPDREMQRLAVLLRSAVILNRNRSHAALPHVGAMARNGRLTLSFPAQWLAKHPLTKLDLAQEAEYLVPVPLMLKTKAA